MRRSPMHAVGLGCALWGALAAGFAVGPARAAPVSAAATSAVPASAAPADTALDHYLEGLRSLRASFTQTVTDAHGARTESGSGSLEVERPGRFRWDYRPDPVNGAAGNAAAGAAEDTGQLLVADGRNLWFYDRELQQVSVKPFAAALSATPVMLLSGSSAQLHASFRIADDGVRDGLRWVGVQPRSAEADFSHAALGFAGDQLVRMDIDDRLGQRVQLQFTRSDRNARLEAGEFAFRPPAGADVIGTPQ